MKNSFKLYQGIAVVFFMAISTVFAQQPDSNNLLKRPLFHLENENQFNQILDKGNQILATLRKAEIKHDELVKKYGKKEIIVDGKKVITTQKPVPLSELELLKPMLPEISPEIVEKFLKELQSLEHNLTNYLNKGLVNMSEPLQKQLTPQKATNTLKRINEHKGQAGTKFADQVHFCHASFTDMIDRK